MEIINQEMFDCQLINTNDKLNCVIGGRRDRLYKKKKTRTKKNCFSRHTFDPEDRHLANERHTPVDTRRDRGGRAHRIKNPEKKKEKEKESRDLAASFHGPTRGPRWRRWKGGALMEPQRGR